MDIAIANWMLAHRDPILTHVCDVLMWFGSSHRGMAVVLLLVFLASVLRRRRIVTLGFCVAVIVSFGASLVLKSLVARPRPGPPYAHVYTNGWSMPSSAAAMTTAGLLVLLLLAPPGRSRALLGLPLLALDLSVGFAVVYLGAHWATDVVAGTALGAVVGILVLSLTVRFRQRRRPA